MATTTVQAHTTPHNPNSVWSGGRVPMGARWGKLMMWFFLVSDAFTFSGLLISYGLIRYSKNYWPDPEKVFRSFPGGFENAPLVFVGLMTFILIASSVTMVLAVDAGHRRNRKEVLFYLFLTIVGGIAFLSCQAWEWAHLIHSGCTMTGNPFGPNYLPPATPTPDFNSPKLFGQLFFTITGFHGGHVTSGVVILIILFNAAAKGVYDKTGDYEMVEKVGLYWHFVDLVWVFVFTFFYLV